MIKVAKLYETAKLPTRKFPEDAGMDLYAHVYEYGNPTHIIVHEGDTFIVRTGITVEIPHGYVGLIFPKSRNDHLVGAGVVDSNYQGEIMVKVVNTLNTRQVIKHHAPIGQLVIVPVITPEIQEVSKEEIHIKKTNRGTTGGIVSQKQ